MIHLIMMHGLLTTSAKAMNCRMSLTGQYQAHFKHDSEGRVKHRNDAKITIF